MEIRETLQDLEQQKQTSLQCLLLIVVDTLAGLRNGPGPPFTLGALPLISRILERSSWQQALQEAE